MAEKYPAPEVGQVWADNDPRVAGRTLRVDEIDQTHARCTVLTAAPDTARTGNTVRINLKRFRPVSNGYRLL